MGGNSWIRFGYMDEGKDCRNYTHNSVTEEERAPTTLDADCGKDCETDERADDRAPV